MNKFVKTLKNIFSIEELRNRILFTLALLAIFRLGSYIVLPGVNPAELADQTDGILGMLNVFLGGSFSRASIFALGIMPYISASIVIQLLSMAVPYFQRMQKEGESGRKRINQITRVLTIVITLFQGSGYLYSTIPTEAIVIKQSLFYPASILIMTAGTIFCMWLGEKITEKGIGNGISMLIMIGIISGLPVALYQEVDQLDQNILFVAELVTLFFIVMGVVLLNAAVRKVPVQYARQVVGAGGKKRTLATGQRSYIPLKVNAANVMPIIFAQSLMFLPSMIAGIWADQSDNARWIQQNFADFTSLAYNLTFAILILVFTYFYTAITINPDQMAEDLKRNNAFVPNVKPGEETSNFISWILDRITLPSAVYLAVVAILPAFASMLGVSAGFSRFYGGTSLIIMVGVILDTLQQIESYLLMQNYDSMMKSGNIKGRQNVATV
ncbi:preprotein translocase subunit SecY [Flammeovirga yaeyamensis]|uniref:Protein translocase subunit SecY n=1 Tax=Flammeovirga yaeyamensis TaxID=367791 RepID=A0AAX1N248_9BACT|nr:MULTISPECIES: preprotein translocase subunit SecY [Flammeovirga]ANQ51006.2 preprotein translocase subunit SecY [Flammeovirga sp. MY04]MBB3701116.1 preprotein translocase subunit SecY [Flammeovirga yaeyamensis]NMF38416.1 preprotein translocase subunit SecY [Flammeovirga yaeyamensis]QWG01584.1 preprotein translocase subunit SecY [Flammeovirga yaeyamensis]